MSILNGKENLRKCIMKTVVCVVLVTMAMIGLVHWCGIFKTLINGSKSRHRKSRSLIPPPPLWKTEGAPGCHMVDSTPPPLCCPEPYPGVRNPQHRCGQVVCQVKLIKARRWFCLPQEKKSLRYTKTKDRGKFFM